jgi:hypothetical protein
VQGASREIQGVLRRFVKFGFTNKQFFLSGGWDFLLRKFRGLHVLIQFLFFLCNIVQDGSSVVNIIEIEPTVYSKSAATDASQENQRPVVITLVNLALLLDLSQDQRSDR